MYAELIGDYEKQRIKSLCDNILNFENDAALGLSCTETTRNAAANELYGKSFKDLSESQKQLTLLKMVEDANAASGALGQAARESDTWTNQTGNLQQAWTDFQAVLGQPILEYAVSIVGWLAEKVGGLTEKFSNGTNPVQWFIDKISSLLGWFEDIGAYASITLYPVIYDLRTAFDMVTDAIKPLIDKFVDYVTNGEAAEDITNIVKDAIDFLADAFEGAIEFVTNMIQGFQDMVTWGQENETMLQLVAVAVGTLTAAIVAYNIAQAIKNAGGIVEVAQLAALAVGLGALTVAETAHTVATTVGTAVMNAWNAAVAFATSPITLVIAAIGALIAIGVLLYKNWDTVKEFCLEAWESIRDGVEKATGALEKWIKNTWDSIKAKTTDTWNELKTFIPFVWDSIKTSVSNAINAVKSTVTNIWDSIKSTTSNVWEGIKSSVSNVVNNVKSTVSNVFNSLKSTITTIWDGIKTAITNPINTALSTVKSVVEKIKSAFDFSIKFDLKLPHVSISGGVAPYGIGGKGSLPKFNISWFKKAYDEAMILEDPTIFGYSAASGKMLGGGDGNGNEVVSGEAHLMDLIGNVIESKTAEQNEKIISLLTAMLNAMVGGNHEIIRALMSDRTFTVGEREFARLVKQYA